MCLTSRVENINEDSPYPVFPSPYLETLGFFLTSSHTLLYKIETPVQTEIRVKKKILFCNLFEPQ